jgi:hypothetical protein
MRAPFQSATNKVCSSPKVSLVADCMAGIGAAWAAHSAPSEAREARKEIRLPCQSVSSSIAGLPNDSFGERQRLHPSGMHATYRLANANRLPSRSMVAKSAAGTGWLNR